MTGGASLTFLTLDEVASVLRVGKRTVERWVANKDLASFKKGHILLVSQESLIRFVKLNTLNPKRPEWCTEQIERDADGKIEAIVERKLRAALMEKAA